MTTQIIVDGVCVWEAHEPQSPYDEDKIRDAVGAAKHFEAIRNLPQEAFAVLELNGRNQPIKPAKVVSLGALDQALVIPREVFADAVADRAAAVIVAHNHPSGTLEASYEDVSLTDRLVKAGKILGIRVLDHIILSREGSISLRAEGKM